MAFIDRDININLAAFISGTNVGYRRVNFRTLIGTSYEGEILIPQAAGCVTDNAGEGSVTLATTADTAIRYTCEIYDGDDIILSFVFDLERGNAIALSELYVAGTGDYPQAVYSYIDEKIDAIPGGSGDVATDTIFDAKGDIPAGTGNNAATKLPVGANNTFLTPDSAVSNGLKWITAAAVKALLVMVKGDVGLGNVDNTADVSKPVSTAQAAGDAAVLASAIQRANHTGTQAQSTVVNLVTDLADKFSKAADDTDDITVGTTNKFATAAEKTKLANITITQAVDLDDIESRVNNLDAAVVLKGTWNASAGTFPGSGTAQAGASYIVSVAGTVDSVAFNVGDRIIAILDNASTSTFASNWFKADYTDQVLSVNGQTGAVSITTVTGNAGTATALQTARTIGGVSFDGTANITVSTATGGFTVSGGNLAVGANSITITGSIGSTGSRVTKLWAVDGEFTNLPTVGGAALKTALSLNNVDNTSNATERAAAATLTNKRITKRVLALSANSATPAINTDNCDVVHITAQTTAITSLTTNLTGTPADGDTLRISITGTASVAITFGASFEASTLALPTTTSGTARLDMGFFWNTETSKWRLQGYA